MYGLVTKEQLETNCMLYIVANLLMGIDKYCRCHMLFLKFGMFFIWRNNRMETIVYFQHYLKKNVIHIEYKHRDSLPNRLILKIWLTQIIGA